MRKKWWQLANTEKEKKLFEILSRHSKFQWRSLSTIIAEMRIDPREFQYLIEPFIKNKIIIVNKMDKGIYLGYWEVVEKNKPEAPEEGEDPEFDPDII